ncbi:hypothetical protein [uncultured Duncaniella sp.]|uniref:hypothetical protein n=1 Tax=uncultured Duncaniella sp. TaxID=2768039 RepID=UPI0027367983|nr:hypothetical protein [uncultured Duncaniella sp.]
MAKKRQKTTRFSIQGFDLNHYRATEQYAAAVQALFDRATLAIAQSVSQRKIDPDKPFSFDDYPEVKAELQKVVGRLASQLKTTIETGSKNQWLFACDKNDGFIDSIMDTSKLSKARLKKMQDRNLDALSTFQARKVAGMDLSQRVWRYVGQYRDQLETALDVGLGEGRSAQQLARDVKQNLRDPDRLFRRVQSGRVDKDGNPILVLSKAARAFHPGRGVYRSSVKNAQRLTRSEINMAYRESDFLRWQQLDFVVGFEIHRSNHEPLCKCKMCDRLQGRYPKTFKFKGWHPQCMCYAVPILMDEETFDENELGDLKAALRGTEYKKKQAKNLVTDVPDGFKEWVAENMEASAGWASTPYFIKDNFVDGDLAKGLKIALPEPEVDPVQAQLDALMPSVEAARKIAEEWGLELRLKGLDAAVAAKDVKDINKFISLITSEGTKYTTELSAFFKDAAQLIKDINAAGVDVLPDVVAELTQYMTNLSADKSMWADGSLFYKSELEKAKDKLRQYKASPEARLSVYKKGVVAQVRDSIKTADEWGVKTTTLRNLLDSFLADIDNDTIFDKMQDEMYRLDGRVYSATKKADKFITDAEVLIKEADALGVDSTELRKQVFYLRGGDRAYSWANFKRDRDAAFTNLQAKVEEAKKNKPKDEDFSKMEEHLSKSFKVNYNAVSELPKPLAETEIIGRVGGGDLTQGSCSSLAFTYCANRIGLNVLDFRDGESRRFFSRTRNIAEIARKLGGVVEESKNNFTVAHKLLKMVEIGKEYYFTCGQHAAVVRRTATGLEFLELQSATSNGWKPLNDTVLKYRFGAKKSCTRGGFTLSMQGCLIELSLFKGNSGFKKIMGYINTAESEQKKGSKGTTK